MRVKYILNHKVKGWVVFFATIFVLTGCSSVPTKIRTSVVMPAKYHEATQIRDVAVLPFGGVKGREFAVEIENCLSGIMVNEKPYFKLVDRMTIDKVVSETKLMLSGMVDSGGAAEVGKLVGAKGIYSGAVTASSVEDTPYTEKRTRCASYTTYYMPYGKSKIPFQACAVWEPYPVSCTKRVATFTFVPKLIEVESGRIVYSNNISESYQDEACVDKRAVKDKSELLTNAKESVKQKFLKDVAPFSVVLTIELMEDMDNVKSEHSKKKFESAISFAKANRLDRACELWKESEELSPGTLSVLYNLGICAEVAGDLHGARDYYKKADKLLEKPDRRISDAIMRINRAIENQKKLQKQQ